MKIREYYITLHKTSTDPDTTKPAWVVAELGDLEQLCGLLGTDDTVFSAYQLRSIGAETVSPTSMRVKVTITSDAPFKCDNCGRLADRDELPQAKNISMRLEPGGVYTDVECPDCGALCFPVEGPDPNPVPNQELTLGLFRSLTDHLPSDAVMTYHGYDKGCCLLAYWSSDVWFYPKDSLNPTHVVINPGRDFDNRRPDEPMNEVVVPPTDAFTETEMLEILEVARLALNDNTMFDQITETSDLSEDYLIALCNKIQAIMDSDVRIFNTPNNDTN